MLDTSFYMILDQYYDQGRYEDAEAFLISELDKAGEDERNHQDRATILNELMGFYRVKADWENCEQYLKALLRELRYLELNEGLTFATFTLNIANAYRAMGRTEEAERDFLSVQDIYERELAASDYRLASLYNNLSLVCLDKGEYDRALSYMHKALRIVEEIPGAELYVAVTNVNIANVLMKTGEMGEAKVHAESAKMIFESIDQKPAEDFAAVMNMLGKIAVLEEDYSKAEVMFSRAADVIRNAFGENSTFFLIMKNLNNARERSKEKTGGKNE